MSDSTTPEPDMTLVPLTERGLEANFSEMESLSVKALLEANGIQVMMVGATPLPNLPVEILVPACQLADAIRIVRDAQVAIPPPAAPPAE